MNNINEEKITDNPIFLNLKQYVNDRQRLENEKWFLEDVFRFNLRTKGELNNWKGKY